MSLYFILYVKVWKYKESKAMKFKFAAAINCIDGRVQAPVAEFIRNTYDIDYIDMITTPGPDKLLSEYNDIAEIESIKNKLLISRNNHNSGLVFIAGHCDCAGNPCIKEDHLQQIRKAVENIKAWGMGMQIYGIWVDEEQKAFPVKYGKITGSLPAL
jgi:hypothetical protein